MSERWKFKMEQNVLVCFTIQEKSKILISKGADIANDTNANLHILHVRKGDSIFDTPNSTKLTEELFNYGKNLGAEAHFMCSDNIISTVAAFIRTNNITHLVVGAPINTAIFSINIIEQLSYNLNDINITIIEPTTEYTPC